jgi:hypothetical protein
MSNYNSLWCKHKGVDYETRATFNSDGSVDVENFRNHIPVVYPNGRRIDRVTFTFRMAKPFGIDLVRDSMESVRTFLEAIV